MKCPGCGSSLWDGSQCSACGRGRTSTAPSPVNPAAAQPGPVPTAWDVTKQHADDVRNKAFWTAIVVTLLLAPSPALITKALGKPKAGLEDAITLWNVLWHTLPLTIAAAIDGGILMWYAKHPDRYPKTDKDKTTMWCWLGGILVASMLLGGWLGKVEVSKWSQARIDQAQAFQKTVDPSGRQSQHYARGIAHNLAHNKAAWPIAIGVGAFAAIANYFTLYGPAMFFSSLVVGAFLGWVWALKLPRVIEDIDRASKSAEPGAETDTGRM